MPSRSSRAQPAFAKATAWKGPGADSEEKREPASDIDIAVVDSLKALDLKWPIREADISRAGRRVSFVANADIAQSFN
jgi:hypothetical protein